MGDDAGIPPVQTVESAPAGIAYQQLGSEKSVVNFELEKSLLRNPANETLYITHAGRPY